MYPLTYDSASAYLPLLPSFLVDVHFDYYAVLNKGEINEQSMP